MTQFFILFILIPSPHPESPWIGYMFIHNPHMHMLFDFANRIFLYFAPKFSESFLFVNPILKNRFKCSVLILEIHFGKGQAVWITLKVCSKEQDNSFSGVLLTSYFDQSQHF